MAEKRLSSDSSDAPAGKRVKTENAASLITLTPETRTLFEHCAATLTEKYDRHERLVKKSRDITIASKRTIFLLHRAAHDGLEQVKGEAEEKMAHVRTLIGQIAKELEGKDPVQYSRAFSPGLQEYVEATTFFGYETSGRLLTLADLELQLHADNVQFDICPSDYILGVADLTGELMRKAIACVGTDETTLQRICAFTRSIHAGFTRFTQNATSRELTRKVQTLQQSLQKVEAACYTMKVRGSELPKERLLDALNEEPEDRDLM